MIVISMFEDSLHVAMDEGRFDMASLVAVCWLQQTAPRARGS
jgi:hypothetical protein